LGTNGLTPSVVRIRLLPHGFHGMLTLFISFFALNSNIVYWIPGIKKKGGQKKSVSRKELAGNDGGTPALPGTLGRTAAAVAEPLKSNPHRMFFILNSRF
jgi:hypothetical protein